MSKAPSRKVIAIGISLVLILLIVFIAVLILNNSEDDEKPSAVKTEDATTTTTSTTRKATTTTEPADPHDCGDELTAIKTGAESAKAQYITAGVGEPVCRRSSVDPTWARLDYISVGGTSDDSLLLHFDAGAWTVAEHPPAPNDAFRQYYFFGCDGPVAIYQDLDLC